MRAFPHLFRFDGIYHELMLKGNGARIFGEATAFPLLAAWVSTHMFGLPALRSTCDLQVATRFYRTDLPMSAADALYDRERIASGAWLPTREEWARKRDAEGLSEAQIEVKTRA